MVAGSNSSIGNAGAVVKHTPNIDRFRVRIPTRVVAHPGGLTSKPLFKPDPIDNTGPWWRSGRGFAYRIEGPRFEPPLGWSPRSGGLKFKQLFGPDPTDETSPWWRSARAFTYHTGGPGFESRLGWSLSQLFESLLMRCFE